MGDRLDQSWSRADEVIDLINAVSDLIKPFIKSADDTAASKVSCKTQAVHPSRSRVALVDSYPPEELSKLLNLSLPKTGGGKDAVLDVVSTVLEYSVNTWDEGFMDKLYASTNAVGVASELLLATLNTNVHVYQVSPVLTLIEKYTTRTLASLFGLTGSNAGGVTLPGGSASNQTSVLIARNTLFPETKTDGYAGKRFVLFTSAHGHYSLEKAAQWMGFGSKNVISVPVDDSGRMVPVELSRLVQKARAEGGTPFYVNTTAGTTVLGSFDPFEAIADICKREGLWMHVDGSWGGSTVFSDKLRQGRLDGVERADSIAINPHKMLGVPMTCSFLLGKDLREFHKANTLPAEYLFHNNGADQEVYDLADLTPQCGRRGDSLKLFLGWIFYGKLGYSSMIEHAFDTAEYLYSLLEKNSEFVLVSRSPLPCLQVCFYWTKGGKLSARASENDLYTQTIARELIPRGWMIDYAPGESGNFLRAVVSISTSRETVVGLVKAIESIGTQLEAPI